MYVYFLILYTLYTKKLVHYKNLYSYSTCVAPKRPVEVTVSAKTIIGIGRNASKIFFTSEGSKEVHNCSLRSCIIV